MMRFMAHMKQVTTQAARVRKKLRAQMHFSHTNYSPHISTLRRTINNNNGGSGVAYNRKCTVNE